MTDAMARATARSAAGSVTVMPPTAAANIWAEAGISTAVRQARTASRRFARAGSMPSVCGRGGPVPPPPPGPSSACTSTSSGRRPCRTGTTTLPGTPAMRSPSSSGPGSGTARRPSSRISKMPTSPAGPKRCLTDVSTRRAWWRSPSKESTVSTRCSTARGPARSPSLVTWPTRRRGTPVDFAIRVRRSTQVRTWARLPAGCPSSGSETDCSESTTTSAGRCRSTAASIASTSGPSMASRFRGTGPIRDARPRTWASDSSAEASMTSRPVAASDESTWKSSVDLPMPGGPNSSVTEPATTPPPMTRSTSLTPVGSGRVPSVDTSTRASAGAPSALPDLDPARRTGPGGACSTRRRRGSAPPPGATLPRRTHRDTQPRHGRGTGSHGHRVTLREGCHTTGDPPPSVVCCWQALGVGETMCSGGPR